MVDPSTPLVFRYSLMACAGVEAVINCAAGDVVTEGTVDAGVGEVSMLEDFGAVVVTFFSAVSPVLEDVVLALDCLSSL
jgi:hypothetical protein